MNAPQKKIEMPLELKKYPLSLEEKREVISTLQYIFKRIGSHKKAIKQDLKDKIKGDVLWQSLLKGIFDGYFYMWDDWDLFIEDIFSKLESYLLEFISYQQQLAEDPLIESGLSEIISLKELNEGSLLISRYLDIIESLIHSWIRLIGDEGSSEELFFQKIIEKNREIETFFSHPIFSFTKFKLSFHTFFLQCIIEVFLKKRHEEMTNQRKDNRKLSLQISKLQRKYEETTASLRESIRKNVQHTISTPVNTTNTHSVTKLEKENKYLHAILADLGYDIKSGVSPEEWLMERDDKILKGKSFEWEHLALEEAHRADYLQLKMVEQKSYIAFIEHQLNGTYKWLAKQYREERWNARTMKPDEMMMYLSDNPEITQGISSYIIDFIECLNSRIGGNSLSSKGNSNTWIGSGHIANIVIVPLLNFIKERLKNKQYEYLAFSWKKIVENYIKDAGWNPTEWNCPTFSLLFNHLPDEPGNIANIEALAIGMRMMETKLDANLKELCEIISKLFEERMTVLQRQIFANKNRTIEQ